MRLAVGLLSFAFPLRASIGHSAHHMPFAPPLAKTSTRHAHSVYGHDDVRGNVPPTEPIATALQQKVSD
jgi:hypothetical protein